ncbi:sialin-like isoform X2 [Antedon mediterranea]
MCCVANAFNFFTRTNWSIVILSMKHAFDWDMKTQQAILGAIYYGYSVTPMIGGWLVGKYGGFPVLLSTVAVSSLIALLSPLAARCGIGLLISSRIIDGFGQGMVYASTIGIIAKWSKLNELSTFVSITTSGYSVGAIASSYVSSLLTTSTFLGGWPSTFYIIGIAGIIWCLCWWIVGSSDVTNNRWISEFEKESITTSRPIAQDSEVYNIRWKKLAISAPVWSICIYCIGDDFGLYLLGTDMPIFFKTILHFDIEMSGFLSCIAQIAFFLTTIFGGIIADKLIYQTKIKKIHVRHFFACFCLGLQSILLILIGYISYDWIAAILMIIAFGLYGVCTSTICANALDIAPNHSALVIGIAFTFSGVTGFIGPAVVGAITEIDNTLIQWRSVFWIAAGVQAAGLLQFLVFGSAEIQEWAKSADNSTETSSLIENSSRCKDRSK